MPLVQTVRQLGMPLYFCQPPTGYADRADAWVNTGALLNRMNFALRARERPDAGRRCAQRPLDRGRCRLPRSSASALAGDVSPPTAATLAKADDAGQVDRADARLAGIPEEIVHAVPTRLPEERRARARQPRVRAGVSRAHDRSGRRRRGARC